MRGTKPLLLALSLFVQGMQPAGAQQGDPPRAVARADSVPLFASEEPLALTFIADFDAIRKDRSEDPKDRPARMVISSGDTLEVELRPRGNFRRDPANCSFPPLRLDVKRRPAEGTVFEGQDKLKMVVPCRPEQSVYEQYVLLEYAIYQAYRVLTDLSFHVRLARMSFVDSGGGRAPFTAWGFLIEEDEVLAEHLGGTLVDIPEGAGVRPHFLNPRQSTLNAVFQYMVGNSDWSDQALHNVKLVEGVGLVLPVPYDFDFSGIVDARYATPDPLLGIRDVTVRIYRGWCFESVDREGLLALFREKRPAFQDAFRRVPGLEEERLRKALSYLDGFYEDIQTADRANRRMFRDCRPTA